LSIEPVTLDVLVVVPVLFVTVVFVVVVVVHLPAASQVVVFTWLSTFVSAPDGPAVVVVFVFPCVLSTG
jgi:hypothetical protein